MVRSVNKQLGIQSPSRVFRQIGKYAADGLLEGLQSVNRSDVRRIVTDIANEFKAIDVGVKVGLNPDIAGLQKKLGNAKISISLQADSIGSDISKAVEKGVRGASKQSTTKRTRSPS
jgi:hypothetical protein